MASIEYVIQNQIELNFSYMPFIKDGGLFIPTNEEFQLGDAVTVELKLPGHPETHQITGKVVWITPQNSLYQIFSGIGIQFVGDTAKTIHDLIRANIDNTIDTGGYAYGIGNTENGS